MRRDSPVVNFDQILEGWSIERSPFFAPYSASVNESGKRQQLHIKRMWHVNKALGLDAECPTSLSPNLKCCNLPLYFISIMCITCLATSLFVVVNWFWVRVKPTFSNFWIQYVHILHTHCNFVSTVVIMFWSWFFLPIWRVFSYMHVVIKSKKLENEQLGYSLRMGLEKWYKTVILVKSFFSHETWPFLAPNDA